MAEQRYRVIERLEAGGMAEVFIGEAASMQGFKKRVAIERVLPHLAQNTKFITMFVDEARLGARLNHANIVQVFDIGAADNTYFIVMEYVDGGNMKTVMETLRKQGRHFPVKEALYICMEACRGLSYAHELTDEDNNPLHIVHRDVSPPNIMLSKRGEVKVMDFGLAKATTQLEKTDPGVVKGKFSYLAPEQAFGQEADARADVFALGIVLWEMLAGRRLFLGETDYQTVKLVQQTQVPTLVGLNPEVDPALDELLRKALARDREQRFQSARELGDALAGYLFGHKLKVTSYDVATLVSGVVSQAQKSKGAPVKGQQSIIDRLIQDELLRFTSLDDMSNPQQVGSMPLSPDDVNPAKALTGEEFENPAEWFSDADFADPNDPDEDMPTMLADRGWQESGIEAPLRDSDGDLANLLESEAPGEVSEPTAPSVRPPAMDPLAAKPVSNMPAAPPRASDSIAPAKQLSLKPEAAPIENGPVAPAGKVLTATAPAKKSAAWVYVLVAVALVGAGAAAAWFTGVIPH